ncbi:MAG TPA: S41 family peptidase [Candidatus Methylomirabilis sp.]|nr:S41 family peptidase [Candidatus Methylomirabilis sp.]
MLRLIRDWKACLIFLVMGFAGGAVMGSGLLAASAPSDEIPADAASNFRLEAEAWNTIQRAYVDRAAVNPTRLTYGAISGMVNALGDTGHSRFLTPEMRTIEREANHGTLEGIGAEVQVKHDQVVIVAPLDRSPAQRAGLKPGDIILKVDGGPVSGLPLDEVVGRILGPANTRVGLTILTPSTGSTRDLTLLRARITLHNVTWHRLPGTTLAHLRIASFSKGVTHDLRNALLEIQHQGLTGLILDLRNDPGGLFDEALGTASQFRTGGDVLLEKDSAGKVTPVPVRAGGVAADIPMVVLINGGTASAAEIVGGALTDAHRARLVGEKTFGTGTLLETFPLSDGSALLLATKEWLTPAGHLIWHRGISPDVRIPMPRDASPLLPEAEQGMTPAGLRSSGDAQLLRALDLLQQPAGQQAGASAVSKPTYSQ